MSAASPMPFVPAYTHQSRRQGSSAVMSGDELTFGGGEATFLKVVLEVKLIAFGAGDGLACANGVVRDELDAAAATADGVFINVLEVGAEGEVGEEVGRRSPRVVGDVVPGHVA